MRPRGTSFRMIPSHFFLTCLTYFNQTIHLSQRTTDALDCGPTSTRHNNSVVVERECGGRLFGGERSSSQSEEEKNRYFDSQKGRVSFGHSQMQKKIHSRFLLPQQPTIPTLPSPPPPPLSLCLPLSGQRQQPQTEHSGDPLGDPSARVFEVFLAVSQ